MTIIQNKQVLNDIVENILDTNHTFVKVIELLQVKYDDNKNIIMMLLESNDFYNVKRLLEIDHILFDNIELFTSKDQDGNDILSYFIQFAPLNIIEELMQKMVLHISLEEKKMIINNKNLNGENHLMLMCKQKKFSDIIFKEFIDIIASSFGIDFLYSILVMIDKNGNNILILAIKYNNTICKKIFNIINQTFIDDAIKNTLYNKLFMQQNVDQENVLILSLRSSLEILNEIFKVFINIPTTINCFQTINRDGYNVLSLAILQNNDFFIKHTLQLIETLQTINKRTLLIEICKSFYEDNFISICLEHDKGNIYTDIMYYIEKYVENNLIVDVFQKVFMRCKDLLHKAFITNNINVIISIIKYSKMVGTLSDESKKIISSALLQRTLLFYAIEESNVAICKMILDLALEYCNTIELKLIINSKDKLNRTPYMIAKKNNNTMITSLLERFAKDTNNFNYLSTQLNELKKMNFLASSHMSKFIVKVL